MVDTREQVPDLPSLESVRTDSRALIPIMVVYGGSGVLFSAFIVRLYLKYAQYIDAYGRAITAVVAMLGAFILVRVLSGYLRYSTDANGLTMAGPLRRRFVPWLSVQGAHVEKTKTGCTQILLETDAGTVTVAPGRAGLSNSDVMEASIFQHLRRIGRSGGLEMSPGAQSLWAPVGDDVPDELDWGMSPTRRMRTWGTLALAFMVSILAGACVVACMTPRLLLGYSPMLLGYVFMLRSVFIAGVMYRTHRLEIRKDGLRAECLFDLKDIPWSSVTGSSWGREGLSVKSCTSREEVLIPYRLGDKESERLMLSVIRHLRTAGVPQAITMPALVSKDPSILQRPAYTNERLVPLQRAFLNTLEEPARTRVRRLHNLQLTSIFVGMLLAAVFAFADVLGRISAHIHAGPDVRYFMTGTSLPLLVPLMFAGIVLPGLFTDWLCARMAGAYASEWRQFAKVGASRFSHVLVRVFALIAVAAVLSIPAFVDWYMKISDNGIVVNELTSVSERNYSWDRIRGVVSREHTRYDHGRPKTDVTYVIRFADGSAWSFGDDTSVLVDRKRLAQAADFVAARAGLRIEHKSL